MAHNMREFSKAVSFYRQKLRGKASKGKACLVVLPLSNEKAFFSLAPLSRAVHELGADMNVFVLGKENRLLPVLERCWKLYRELSAGKKGKGGKALAAFIKSVEKKTKSRQFSRIFKEPDFYITTSSSGFQLGEKGAALLPFQEKWLRKRRWKQLLATSDKILRQGYGIKKSERLSIGFELIPRKKDLQLPLQDYLDSYLIARAFATKARSLCRDVSMGSSTSRMSQLEPMDRISDLSSTLSGCEYEKKISEPWFKAFKNLSPHIGSKKLRPSDAAFGIHGKGYGGKHFFGMAIGYPTPNKKSRWQGPSQMFLKPWWLEQSKVDSRKPLTRYAITETLPIENFVRTCNIDYFAMRKRDDAIRAVLRKCTKLFVRGKKLRAGRTDLALDMKRIHSGKSPVLASDIEVNPSTRPEAASIFKVKAGRYGNFPGGEVFFTPYGMHGLFVGDVVINVDQSYVIPASKPLVVKVKGGRYRVLSGPKKILKALRKRKRDSLKLISILEKNKSMPRRQILSMRKNFNRVGEFAINTNPNARLSRYLIETEKMARMIHIALGSGYEPGRETTYHCDIVLNSPRQGLDIFGLDERGKQQWIIKKGKMVV